MSFLAFARALGGVVLGIDGHLVEVEVHVGPGLPEFRLVGLPGAAVRESRDRVRAALRQLGVSLPAGRITVNLAPARLPKPGSGLDLPIACAVMAAAGRLPTRALEGWLLVGELSLDGSVRASDGTVSVLVAARQAGLRRAVVPLESWPAARLVDGLALQPVATLAQAVEGLARGRFPPVPPDHKPQRLWPAGQPAGLDLAEVRGHALARRALEVAAAGGHPLMLVGPPGSGKTMLAQRLPTLLPPLDRQRWLEVVQVYTAAGRLFSGPGAQGVPPAGWRPFRSPHHSLTRASLVGGGSRLAPGELTLAHRGVLFLDEFAELSQDVVDALREPMEEGWVTLARAGQVQRLPADVLVVAASNPCGCGRLGLGRDGARDQGGRCRCRPVELARYHRRLAGPVADRFDLWVWVRPASQKELLGPAGESSAAVRGRVELARDRQRHRLGRARSGPFEPEPLNARMSAEEVKRCCALSAELEAELLRLSRAMGLSARGVHGVLKVARTLADLEGRDRLVREDLHEAVQLRRSGLGGG